MDPVRRLQSRITDELRAQNAIPDGAAVIAGVSGGPDSVCLLHILHALAPERGWHLQVAHVNHLLRGVDSDEDEDFVRALSASMGLPFHLLQADVAALAVEEGQSVETVARSVRYRFFERLADERETDPSCVDAPGCVARIAVAHHREDQAETLLMHLFRGSGLQGLAGMSMQNGRIVRPLLTCSRSDILAYLEGAGLTWRVDASNAQPVTTRNRIRLEILPLIEQVSGPDPAARLAGTAAMLRADAAYLERAAKEALDAIRCAGGVDAVGLSGLAEALAGRVVRMLYEEKTGTRSDLGQDHVEAVLSLIRSARSSARADLPGGVRAVCANGVLRMGSRAGEGSPAIWEPVVLQLDGKTRTPGGVFFAASDRTTLPEEWREGSLCVCAFSRAALTGALVRTRRPGDRIRPSRGAGSRTVKRFLIDRKVPASTRDRLPLVAISSEIAWIPGVSAALPFEWPRDRAATGDLVWLAFRPDVGIGDAFCCRDAGNIG